MSELRSVIDELRSERPSDLPDARIEEDFSELHRAIEQLERSRRLAEIDRRRLFERDGHRTSACSPYSVLLRGECGDRVDLLLDQADAGGVEVLVQVRDAGRSRYR